MSPDWSKPSGYARWGWLWAVFAGSGAALNLPAVVSEPTNWVNWAVLAFTAVCVVFCLVIWRKGVRDDREHRAYMTAWARKWGVQ